MGLILITGGLGFVGSHTCVSLLQKGFDILIIDSLNNSKIDNLEKIKKISYKRNSGKLYFYKGDLRDLNWLDAVFFKQFDNFIKYSLPHTNNLILIMIIKFFYHICIVS